MPGPPYSRCDICQNQANFCIPRWRFHHSGGIIREKALGFVGDLKYWSIAGKMAYSAALFIHYVQAYQWWFNTQYHMKANVLDITHHFSTCTAGVTLSLEEEQSLGCQNNCSAWVGRSLLGMACAPFQFEQEFALVPISCIYMYYWCINSMTIIPSTSHMYLCDTFW